MGLGRELKKAGKKIEKAAQNFVKAADKVLDKASMYADRAMNEKDRGEDCYIEFKNNKQKAVYSKDGSDVTLEQARALKLSNSDEATPLRYCTNQFKQHGILVVDENWDPKDTGKDCFNEVKNNKLKLLVKEDPSKTGQKEVTLEQAQDFKFSDFGEVINLDYCKKQFEQNGVIAVDENWDPQARAVACYNLINGKTYNLYDKTDSKPTSIEQVVKLKFSYSEPITTQDCVDQFTLRGIIPDPIKADL